MTRNRPGRIKLELLFRFGGDRAAGRREVVAVQTGRNVLLREPSWLVLRKANL